MTHVAVAIVNYRTADLVVDCLASLADEVNGRDIRVIVADNASGDDSVAIISRAVESNGWSSWASVLPLENNAGFAAGNNAVIRRELDGSSPPEFVLLLNPDTYIRPGAIDQLLQAMAEHPRAGIVGSRLEDPDTTVQRSAFRFPSIPGELENASVLGPISRALSRWVAAPPASPVPCMTDWVAGASMLIRREVFDDIGLMDDSYFLYFEEVDFCIRARRAGWECWYWPASRVVHLVGSATGVTDTKRQPKRRPTYWFDSRRRYFIKNHGRVYAVMADLAAVSGFLIRRLRNIVSRRPDRMPPHFLMDFIRNSTIFRSART